MRDETLTSETELIARARGGDRAAFSALAALYGRRVHTLALHYCRDASDAEDLSQEVWLRAFRSLDTFRAESSFYTWLRRIAINAFLNERRAARPHAEESSRDEDDEATETTTARAFDAESALHEKLLVARVRGALSELAPQQRLAFVLKHEEGMTYEEIARELSCSTGTIKKAVARAVAKLRLRLCVEMEEASDAANDATQLNALAARESY
jgi:RNA polymerase sigma-70 factor (ECF subfamily)